MNHGTAPATSDREILLQIRDDQRTITTKLFGSPEAAATENPAGRLPKVERSAKHAHERIDGMETRMERLMRRALYAGISGTVAAIGMAMDIYFKVTGK